MVSNIIGKLFLNLKASGKENLKNLDSGGALFVANHQGRFDPFLIGASIPFSYFSKIKCFRYQTYYKFITERWYGLFIWLMGAYPVYPGSGPLEKVLEKTVKILKDNQSVLIFPEGKLSQYFDPANAKPGIGYLAKNLNPLIVPVFIKNTHNIKFLEFILRKRRVRITFGQPFRWQDIALPEAEYGEIARRIMGRVGEVFKFNINKNEFFKTLKAEDFGGEHSKRNIFFIMVLWLVSALALITNLIEILFIKLFKNRKAPIKKIMWELGRDKNHISSLFVDRFSEYNHKSKHGAAGWKSLEIFYNYHIKVKPYLKNNLEGKLTRFWIEKMENRQAVANRFKIVINLLIKSFDDFKNEPEIRIVSIAAGSAQAIIEAVKRRKNINIKIILIDLDNTAIEEARINAKAAGLENKFLFINNSTKILEEVCDKFKPQIIEMVGFLDYRPKEKAIRLISRIKDILPENGIFITCNIRKNREKIFLDWVLLWPMVYRSREELFKLILEAGFKKEKVEIISEPFCIHNLAFCKK
ncbi:1-acyl-sn-glycerol-3-phosphate acyltransferase [Patescibacteria group bacterium]|nr:1-acyl-sn-glycerol-3-phosphate acyltransferase [Patescibacteria group bacterium]